mmetsp:Transcript_15754/g.29723  ORF Transcript_15754/g.29723 Transcript_15754/m.29723 type:complete len:150 (-) Transcript_15754:417-866(-)|eukprot:CAMPEP_0176502950 /NCGR_PEP_ID=MMETSP0200_2-20121128/15058_1 /TAXON_ID=947934 /ORGANISM="Chaetoceros sp., Strain GSL56" /LENGTH=149 /DNA_ID=CAMNT_0017902119 /DNA_START=237 /DNA_END=686 /DNA_ORIENTATION=-
MGEVYNGMHTTEGEGTSAVGDDVGELVLIESYLNQQSGCGNNVHDIAFASIDSDLDGVLNRELWEAGQALLPKNETFFMTVIGGGNHGNLGSYDDTERIIVLGQNDDNATILQYLHIDMAVMGIVSVVSRAGVELPIMNTTCGGKKKKF